MFEFGKKKKTLENAEEIMAEINNLAGRIDGLSSEIKKLQERSRSFVQKVGIVRFNPFSDVGGDQSFSIALLDENNDGVVITSLYSRNDNRVYAKPIKNSQSAYLLSEEEKQALNKAGEIKQPNNTNGK
ncbi:MAG: hypothetical protein COT34_00880 [Candidatus Nealsonbacteria bacterium CG08_land_8_20_14_0_20_43_11]|uniref:DUF4446 domain-containing protein n=1 Tax=Candidatus Nealsonbacteria bacterium CG08_land_8_20_14_0_20_43_11 TaxID=1974706 RepID=A0A2M6T1B6_9BACT|nr:MAG: hypothetical protein COT34_00880 [Candidatus Nealsonbacteria bacterium CG08_land_8_20_14_0_20_43_11]